MRRFIIRLLPIFILERLAPYIGTLDDIGNGIYFRLYDAPEPQRGAGLLIRATRKQIIQRNYRRK